MNRGHRSLAVKRTATGLGLFTLQPIRAGKRIIEYIGPLMTTEEAAVRGGKYLFTVDERRVIDGSARSNTARYLNHSCRPNAEAFTYGRRVWIYSKEALQAGKQITIHYGEEYLDAHMKHVACQCEVCVARRDRRLRTARK
jgi:SET domain-containing protein